MPPDRVGLDEPRAFCCEGCLAVWSILHDSGLDAYYALAESVGGSGTKPAAPARPSGRKYEELDDPGFLARHAAVLPDGSRRVELYLEGVRCGACVWLVEKLPEVRAGVIEARLDLGRSLLRVVWRDDVTSLSEIARTLDSFGYPAHPAKDEKSREIRRREDRRFLVRLGVAGAIAGNVMALSFALYGGAFSGIEESFSRLFRVASLAFATVAVAWPGRVFFQGAFASLRTRTPHLDLPVALGLGVGMAAGVVNTFTGAGEVYFDSITVLVFLLLVGRFIQHRQQRAAVDALELLFSLTPGVARRVESNGVRSVPIESLLVGDLVEVAAGETVPVDGSVVEGRSKIDVRLLTGESRPESTKPGEPVRAGSINVSARLRVRVSATGAETRVGRLMRAVEENVRRKAPIVQLVDRVAGWFVGAVLLLAAVTVGAWWSSGPAAAIEHATALLIVTCPCALGLATPLAIAVAIGRAAKRGIFVKGGDALERAARGGTLFLDKTGTLTEGRMALLEWHGDERARPWVAALEAESAHPIAKGLREGLAADVEVGHVAGAVGVLRVVEVEQVDGSGIRGTVSPGRGSLGRGSLGRGSLGGGARQLVVGSPEFVAAETTGTGGLPHELEAAVADLAARARTPVAVAVDGRAVAVAGLGDPIRSDARETLAALEASGFRLGILSGDHPEVVAAVADELGIDRTCGRVHGGVTPERKLEIVREALREGPVLMVGDGVNDAAALAAASVGIAVEGGTEASAAAADVVLARSGLEPLAELASAGRRTIRTIRRGLVASLAYNSVAAALAVAGLLHPWIAALLMPVSSLSVLALALGGRSFGRDFGGR